MPRPFATLNDAQLQGELRGDVDAIIMMALRKEANRRYRTVVEFSDDIQKHLESLPIQARPESFGYWASRFIRRHRAQISAAALGLLGSTVILSGLYFVIQVRQNRHHYTIAGTGGPRSTYTVDDYVYLKLNGKPVGFNGQFTGCGPAKTPSMCPESAAIAFAGTPGDQLEVVAYDKGGGYLMSELWLYKDDKPALKLADEIKPYECKPIPCSWDKWRPEPANFFGRNVTLP